MQSQLEHVAEDCTTALRECDALVDELREMREFQQSEIVSAESLQSYVGRPEGICLQPIPRELYTTRRVEHGINQHGYHNTQPAFKSLAPYD